MEKVLDYLLNIRTRAQAGYLVLIDPDRRSVAESVEFAQLAETAGVDALLIGSSLLISDRMDDTIQGIKQNTSLPTILFPGASHHLSRHADALLFLSLISGRNANFLIGEHVKATPLVECYGLEAIPTGYMLIDGGTQTSVGFMSGTSPIPRDKPDIAWAHALAAEYLGMKFVYLESGSGAKWSVPNDMIATVKEHVHIPIIVGGGISTPEVAADKVRAGADFIVTGNVLEACDDIQLVYEFADAIHRRNSECGIRNAE
ncbi:MAG: geranylgeranylglyceryl/heptaprenylglyceryl phosphate synthase [Deltaproteobacteria bacterium]|nr:geranylgeranylglyceryl/heptaprenylglyceryl phosphate synthase [Deltaproteobacteria bacterium]